MSDFERFGGAELSSETGLPVRVSPLPSPGRGTTNLRIWMGPTSSSSPSSGRHAALKGGRDFPVFLMHSPHRGCPPLSGSLVSVNDVAGSSAWMLWALLPARWLAAPAPLLPLLPGSPAGPHPAAPLPPPGASCPTPSTSAPLFDSLPSLSMPPSPSAAGEACPTTLRALPEAAASNFWPVSWVLGPTETPDLTGPLMLEKPPSPWPGPPPWPPPTPPPAKPVVTGPPAGPSSDSPAGPEPPLHILPRHLKSGLRKRPTASIPLSRVGGSQARRGSREGPPTSGHSWSPCRGFSGPSS
mmetsp:Transcript_32637/g.92553  ORF Transcript_32637/g.92553 Transcript_32637/m.92553 type:complete len:298 (-) Transcript_32637:705-1598(-)